MGAVTPQRPATAFTPRHPHQAPSILPAPTVTGGRTELVGSSPLPQARGANPASVPWLSHAQGPLTTTHVAGPALLPLQQAAPADYSRRLDQLEHQVQHLQAQVAEITNFARFQIGSLQESVRSLEARVNGTPVPSHRRPASIPGSIPEGVQLNCGSDDPNATNKLIQVVTLAYEELDKLSRAACESIKALRIDVSQSGPSQRVAELEADALKAVTAVFGKPPRSSQPGALLLQEDESPKMESEPTIPSPSQGRLNELEDHEGPILNGGAASSSQPSASRGTDGIAKGRSEEVSSCQNGQSG